MKKFFLCLVLAGLSTSWMVAQDKDNAGKSDSKAKVRTVTGCLAKGDSADEFMLTGKDGSTWEARSDKVNLAEHVGHEVSATGVVSHAKLHNMKEDAKDTAKDTGIKKSDREHGHLTITDVKMVGDTCSK
ncbi:MAG: hypothetical protein DMG71_16325 [Acidobacteria bacterium]|nr:MAG: hypothetical protein DMG71_16325 [Acidobacteriota bacterium]